MNQQETLRSIEADKILREFGNYSLLLPDELKHYAKDKIYSQGHQVHNVDTSIIFKNAKLINEGKAFKKRVEQYVFEQKMDMHVVLNKDQ